MKIRNVVIRLAMSIMSLGGAGHASAQTQQMLPVYNVVQSGATAAQAASLAASLNIPSSQLVWSNGLVSFIDPTNFLHIPMLPVTDPNVIRQLEADTVNPYPSIPINFQQMDFGTLSSQGAFGDGSALQTSSNALANAGLMPQFGAPGVSHATLTSTICNSVPTTYSLDTEVNYQFRDPSGYPFVGPGAQVQVAFGPNGNVTRLLYAARQLAPGSLVPIIPANVASNSLAGMFPAGTSFSMDIEYICPPFWWERFRPCPCPPPPPWQVQTILPYWVAQGTLPVTDPVDGHVTSVQTLRQAIPATTSSTFVPSATLTAYSPTGGGVQAYASVSGGMGPYTYVWSGSPGDLGTSNDAFVAYTPTVRVAPPTLQISPANIAGSGGNMLRIAWVPCDPRWCDPPPPWLLEYATDLSGGSNAWTASTDPVQSSNGVSSVTVDGSGAPRFFRLRLATPTLPVNETVSLTVIDANGVSIQTSQTFPAQAIAIVPQGIIHLGPSLSYGTESSVDPGLGTADRANWTAEMATLGAGAGVQRFLWTSPTTWLGDFIDPPVPFTLPPNPQINGDDDYLNWGVDSANIVLYIGHGNPDVITFTATPPLFYNNPQLVHSWGDDTLNWLCLLSCEVLQASDGVLSATDRWGPAFDGLHSLTGFHTLAWAATGFTGGFADRMLGIGRPKQCIMSSWFDSAMAHGTGGPAMLGPYGPAGVCDSNDYYWGKGPVGPTIRAAQITGWWYVSL